jgi:glycosyltransferase involved in cell wall biosynthesis
MKISIIIPVYNEFRTLSQVLDRVRRAALPEGCSKEIIVIDDGTTQMIAVHARAGDLITGHHTAGNFVLTQDGDLEYDPPIMPASWSPL